MTEIFSDVADWLGEAIQDLFSWVLGFLSDIFTGHAITSFGSSIMGVFLNEEFEPIRTLEDVL